MSQPKNINKTGKVTIRRESSFRTSTLVWLRFGVCTLLVALFIAVVIVGSGGWEVYELLVFPLSVGVLFGLSQSFLNKGSMVESVCFDYDGKQVAVVCSDMRNRQSEIVIPFDDFHFRTREYWSYRNPMHDRVKFYQRYEKKAVLVFDCFGWEDVQRQRIEKELEGFFVDE